MVDCGSEGDSSGGIAGGAGVVDGAAVWGEDAGGTDHECAHYECADAEAGFALKMNSREIEFALTHPKIAQYAILGWGARG